MKKAKLKKKLKNFKYKFRFRKEQRAKRRKRRKLNYIPGQQLYTFKPKNPKRPLIIK